MAICRLLLRLPVRCLMSFHLSKSGDEYYFDGGTMDRLGAEAWRAERSGQAIVHAVNRTAGALIERGCEGAMMIRTPRSGASFSALVHLTGSGWKPMTLH